MSVFKKLLYALVVFIAVIIAWQQGGFQPLAYMGGLIIGWLFISDAYGNLRDDIRRVETKLTEVSGDARSINDRVKILYNDQQKRVRETQQ